MSKESKEKPKQIKIEATTSPLFRRIIADRVYGTLDSIGLKATIFSEHNDIENIINKEPMTPEEIALVRTIECELIIKPEQMKALMVWLTNKVQDYEAIYGIIPSPEEVDSKMEKHYKDKSKKNQDLR
jgi:hypothetical protein